MELRNVWVFCIGIKSYTESWQCETGFLGNIKMKKKAMYRNCDMKEI